MKGQVSFTITTLPANSTDNKLIFILFFPYNRFWHFMQIVSKGDNLHEMSKPILYFLGKYELYFKMSLVENFTQRGKH